MVDEAQPQQPKSRLRPYLAILTALGLFIIPQIIVAFGFGFYLIATGQDFDTVTEENSIGLNFGIYAISELLTLAGFFLLLAATKSKAADYGWTLKGLKNIWLVIPAFFVYMAMTITVQILANFVLSEEILNADQELGFEDATAVWELALAFIALVIIAPVVEELLFRGYLFNEIRKDWSFVASAFVTALLFGVAHMQINVGLDTFVLALPLAYLIEQTRTLTAPIALHALKNLVAFLFLFVLDVEQFATAIAQIFS